MFVTMATNRIIGVTRKCFKDCGLAVGHLWKPGPVHRLPFSEGRLLALCQVCRHVEAPLQGSAVIGLSAQRGGAEGSGTKTRYKPQPRVGFSWECMICGNAAGVGRAAPHSPDGNPHGYFSLEATADIFKSKSTWVQAPGGPSQPPRAPGSGSVSEGACYKSIWSLKTT